MILNYTAKIQITIKRSTIFHKKVSEIEHFFFNFADFLDVNL